MDLMFTNNAASTLDAGITSGDTSLTLAAGGGADFPVLTTGKYFYATIVNQTGTREIIKVTTRTSGSDVLGGLTRGVDNTTADAWSAGDKVQLRLPALVVEEIITQIELNETNIGSNDTDISALDGRITALEDYLEAPTGTSLWFNQNTAPTGWTYESAITDRVLAVKGGTAAYNVNGGVSAGSWTPTTHVHDIGAHVHTMPTHIHTMPTHIHSMGTHSHTGYVSGTSAAEPLDKQNGESGSGSNNLTKENHTHTWSDSFTTSSVDPGDTNATDPGDTNATDPGDTNSTDIGDSAAGSAPSTDRPAARVGIIATKD